MRNLMKFPRLYGLDSEELRKLLKRSTLSKEDRIIAIKHLIWDMDYIDIGEIVHMHRTTVGRHMRDGIEPELARLRGTAPQEKAL